MQKMLLRRLLRFAADTGFVLVAGALVSALLFRVTPGADVDARELNPQLSERSIAAIRAERTRNHSATGRTAGYFLAILSGDFGVSETSGAPVSGMIRERIPVTLETVIPGSVGGFLAGLLAAAVTVLLIPGLPEVLTSGAFLALLSMPAGLLVLLAVFGRVPVEVAVGAAVAPRIYFYAARLFGQQRSAPWVLGAVAAGLGSFRIALFQVLPALRSELLALFGFAVVTAIAATIPAEVLTGRAGIGQLAWKSAMERDLPVVIAVTMSMVIAARAVTLLSALPGRDLRQTA